MKIEIIHQTNEWICVNKPSGLSVHNQEDETNLKEVLLKQLDLEWLQPVHRLDKETSGLILIALTKSSLKALGQIFEAHSIQKKYRGIVKGNLEQDLGSWSSDLTDKGEGRNNPQGQKKNRKSCVTHYKIISKNKYFSLCEFTIETGRQHQIRKHCALSKHHLLGDNRYGDKKYNKKISNLYNFNRMALHAYELKFQFNEKNIELICNEPAEWHEKIFSI
jgi:tRNA pseudouridine65 synthase